MIGEESNPKHIWTSPLYFSMVWNGLFHRDQAINEYLLCSKSLGQSVQWPGFSSLLSVQALWEHEFALFLRPRLQISLLAKSWPDCPNLSNKGSYVRFCIAFCNGVTQIWFKSSAQVPFWALLGQIFGTTPWKTMFLVEFFENSHSYDHFLIAFCNGFTHNCTNTSSLAPNLDQICQTMADMSVSSLLFAMVSLKSLQKGQVLTRSGLNLEH